MINRPHYTPLHIHSYNSLLDGGSSPEQNAKRAKELGMKSLGQSDHGTVSGALSLENACNKYELKPIQGIEAYVSYKNPRLKDKTNRSLSHQVIWAKNKEGWRDLLKLVKESNLEENYYYKPRLQMLNEDGVKGLEYFFKKGNLYCMQGHQGTLLSSALWADVLDYNEKESAKLKLAYQSQKRLPSEDYYEQFLKPNWLEDTCELAMKMEKAFGKGNFFIELQNQCDPEDEIPLWVHRTIVKCLREVSKQTGIPAIASGDPHYATKDMADLQRMLVMMNTGETIKTVRKKLDDADATDAFAFYSSNNFFIHSYEQMAKNFTKEELELTNLIASECESYTIREKSFIPKYTVPKIPFPYVEKSDLPFKTDSDKYLYELCIEGAKNKKPWVDSKIDKVKYWDRLREELIEFYDAKLSDYFLTVWDVCAAADNKPVDGSYDWKNWQGEMDPIPRGVGRGSAAGCLVSYLLNITDVDPLKYDLLFSRFWNRGRGDSLPDIDLDFDVTQREWVFGYLKWRYGEDKVGQIGTFGTIKGKAAIKDVFRVSGVGNFELTNEICKHIGEESKIIDDIKEMKNQGDEDYNIIKWTMDNSEEFMKYYNDPKYKDLIDQASRCEGIYRQAGKHPAGIVIMDEPLDNYFPIVFDSKSKSHYIGLNMQDVEKMGGCKIDVLGVAVLSKMKYSENLINGVT